MDKMRRTVKKRLHRSSNLIDIVGRGQDYPVSLKHLFEDRMHVILQGTMQENLMAILAMLAEKYPVVVKMHALGTDALLRKAF